MASNMALVSSGQPNADSLSLLPTLSAEILTQILTTHAPSDIEKLDVESLFSIVNDVLNRATMTVDTVLQLQPGTGPHEATEHLEDKTKSQGSFIPPLCAFKQISCEMQCKGPREKIAGETTLSILKKLSSYSWDAKAVLTLATLALDYGEFCLLAKTQSSDQLAKSMGTLKGVPVLFERLKKHSQAVDDLKKVIKATVEVIKCIIDLTKLSNYAKKDVAVAVYWAIETIVASTTQLCYLITDEEKKQELRPYADKLSVILTNLKKEKAQKKEEEGYRKLKEIANTPKDPVEVLEIILIDPTNKIPPLIDGSTNKPVEINSVKGKSVFLFISGLHISRDDISILKPFLDKTGKEDQYRIVWIPFVKQWTEDLKKKWTEDLKPKWTKDLQLSKMLYVATDYSLPRASHRYINQKWNFKFNEPLIVAFNQQGKVECKNAIHMIRVCGAEAFPFTWEREKTLLMEKGLIGVTATHVDSQIENWIKEKYIFLYGGQDEWIQKFTKSAEVLVTDPIVKGKGISIELVSIQDDNILKRFWNKIKNLFTSRAQRETEMDSMKLHIEKLISYKKKKKEWAVLSQGSSIIVISGKKMLTVLEKFDSWKQRLEEKDFQSVFIEYHKEVLKPDDQICHHMKIPYNTAKIPETMECSHCHRVMDTYISFKCCHNDGAPWA